MKNTTNKCGLKEYSSLLSFYGNENKEYGFYVNSFHCFELIIAIDYNKKSFYIFFFSLITVEFKGQFIFHEVWQ